MYTIFFSCSSFTCSIKKQRVSTQGQDGSETIAVKESISDKTERRSIAGKENLRLSAANEPETSFNREKKSIYLPTFRKSPRTARVAMGKTAQRQLFTRLAVPRADSRIESSSFSTNEKASKDKDDSRKIRQDIGKIINECIELDDNGILQK